MTPPAHHAKWWTVAVQAYGGKLLLQVELYTPPGPTCGAHLAHRALGDLLRRFHVAWPGVEIGHAWFNEIPPPCDVEDDDDDDDPPAPTEPGGPAPSMAEQLPADVKAAPGTGWFGTPPPVEARETIAVFVCEDGHETRVAVDPQQELDRHRAYPCTSCRRPCTYRGSEYALPDGVVVRHLRQKTRNR